MMTLLVADVALDSGKIVGRNAESSVAFLPAEARARGQPVRDRMRREPFDLSHQASNGDRRVEPREQVNVIGGAADGARRTAQVDAFGPDGSIDLHFDLRAHRWPSLPRRPHEMDIDFVLALHLRSRPSSLRRRLFFTSPRLQPGAPQAATTTRP